MKTMNEVKHTPGPWESAGAVIWSPSGKATVAAVSEPRATRFVDYRKLEIDSPDFDEACENVHLITAAPDLLEACQEAIQEIEYLHDKFRETGTGNNVLAKLQSAVEKATPRPQQRK